jgi:hypothetical protein
MRKQYRYITLAALALNLALVALAALAALALTIPHALAALAALAVLAALAALTALAALIINPLTVKPPLSIWWMAAPQYRLPGGISSLLATFPPRNKQRNIKEGRVPGGN